ncbi:Dcp1-like decapping family protein [Phlyctema vagabunda]|uniref:Dcp1-like decapping family protein n=1 Tax=Phlyctema vagabunda TaxID=108571 RepID=A0ABR4P889_9HELO
MTPRKTSRRQQQQNYQAQPTPLVQQSDYDESDAPQVQQQSSVRPSARTNTELNLSVLRRYNPSIHSILSIAASAVVYNFNPPESWEKAGIEGTLFVCEEVCDPASGAVRFCVVILNRRGLNNLILELSEVVHIELAGEYVVVHQGGGEEDQPTKTIGLWMHPDKDDTREVNGSLISQCWEKVMASKPDETVTASDGREGSSSAESWNMVPEQPPLGRKLSLRDLFAQIR